MFIFILAIIFGFRFWWAYKVDYFSDEAFIGLLVQNPIHKIVDLMAADYNTFLYPVLLKWWSFVFGFGHMSLRSATIALSVLNVWVFYKLCLFLFKDKAWSKVATIFYTIIPAVLYYSFEVRYYGFLTFWVLLAIYFVYTKVLREYTTRNMLLFAGIMIAGFYTQVLFVIPAITIGGFLLYKARSSKYIYKYLYSYLYTVLACLYWLPIAFEHLADKTAGGWLTFEYLKTAFYTQAQLFLSPIILNSLAMWQTITASVICVVVLITFFIVRKKHSDMFIGLFIVVQHICFYLISTKTPLYYYKYLSFLIPLYVICFFVCIRYVRKLQFIYGIIAIMLMLGFVYIVCIPINFRYKARDILNSATTVSENKVPIIYNDFPMFLSSAYYASLDGRVVYMNSLEYKIPRYLGKVVISPYMYVPNVDNKNYIFVNNTERGVLIEQR